MQLKKLFCLLLGFFKLHCQSKAKLKFVMCLQALKGEKKSHNFLLLHAGEREEKKKYIYI